MVTRPADDDQPPSPPLLCVVRGDVSSEEIAALVAALVARPADDGAPGRDRSAAGFWADRASRLRRPLSPAPGAWRRSGLPG